MNLYFFLKFLKLDRFSKKIWNYKLKIQLSTLSARSSNIPDHHKREIPETPQITFQTALEKSRNINQDQRTRKVSLIKIPFSTKRRIFNNFVQSFVIRDANMKFNKFIGLFFSYCCLLLQFNQHFYPIIVDLLMNTSSLLLSTIAYQSLSDGIRKFLLSFVWKQLTLILFFAVSLQVFLLFLIFISSSIPFRDKEKSFFFFLFFSLEPELRRQ